MKRRIYAVDPGLSGTGWAEWIGDLRTPRRVGVITQRENAHLTLGERCRRYGKELRRQIKMGGNLDPTVTIYVEMPQQMSSAKGIAAQSGSIYMLTFLVGYYAARLAPCTILDINPVTWKGQLPKDIVQERIERVIGENACRQLQIKTHAWDAVGLGLWAAGLMGE